MRTFLDSALHGSDRPEDTVIVIDTSPSMDAEDFKPSRLRAAQEAGRALLQVKRKHHPRDRVAVVGFHSHGYLIATFHSATDPELNHGFAHTKPGSGTNMGAGLETAHSLFDDKGSLPGPLARLFGAKKLPLGSNGRTRRVIVLSDGASNKGRSPRAVAAELKHDGIVIETIGIAGSPTSAEFNEEEMKAVASLRDDGTPRYYFITDTRALLKTFQQLGHHIRPLSA